MTVTFRHAAPGPAAGPPDARLQRARGRSRVAFAVSHGATRLADLRQEGCAKIRLPRVHDGGGPQAVLINTAGGITGGDEIEVAAAWGEGADATVTSQAAERVYRRRDGVGRVATRLDLAPGARGAWLPQETIVFDGAGLDRRLEVSMAGSARLLAVEALVLGRTAMGEVVRRAHLVDRWRVTRDGRMVFADVLRLSGDPADILAGPSTGGGAAAFATVLLASPEAEGVLDTAREVVEAVAGPGLEAGATAFDGLLLARLVAADGRALRRGLEPLLERLLGRPLPRVWSL